MLIAPSLDWIQRTSRPVLPTGDDAFLWHHKRVRVRREWFRDGLLWTPLTYSLSTFLTSGSNTNDASGTTLNTSATMNLTAGTSLIAWTKWEGTNGATPSVAKSDGTNTFTTLTTANHSNNDLHGCWHYLLTHSMSGATTLRFTLSAARTFRKWIVCEFSYSGTASFDTSAIAVPAASSVVSSGNITAGSTSQIVCGAYGEYSGQTTASEQINGVAADGKVTVGTYTTMWRRVNVGGFTGAATANNLGSPADMVVGIISLLVAAGPSGGGDFGGMINRQRLRPRPFAPGSASRRYF